MIQTPYGAALCNIGTMCGNQVIFITRHGVGHKTAPHKVNYRANIFISAAVSKRGPSVHT